MADPYSAAEGLVRVYPAREPNGTGLVWAHGGGFAGGDLDMPEADWVARTLATRGTTVVSVDYRLAPTPAAWAAAMGTQPRGGVHYPAASDDIVSAWRWTLENAARLRVDADRLTVGGASAGGNLVTGAVLRMASSGVDRLPALVVLAYPTLLAVQPAPSPDLRAALDANPEAAAFFATLTSQNRYAILYRVEEAKRPETRARRIEKFVGMLERGETLY
jgi:acetyl esterase